MVKLETIAVYLAVKNRDERSRMEDTLVLDGVDISTFSTATALWTAFQAKPARIVIAERRFADGFSGLDLTKKVRTFHLTPYVYTVVISTMNNLSQIREALAVGVDDYLVRPHNPFQLRSRILVGIRWLNYVDSLFEDTGGKG